MKGTPRRGQNGPAVGAGAQGLWAGSTPSAHGGVSSRPRLTFQTGAAGRPPRGVPLVFGGHALHLPRGAGRRGAVEVLGAHFVRELLRVGLRVPARRTPPGALLPVKGREQRGHSGTASQVSFS